MNRPAQFETRLPCAVLRLWWLDPTGSVQSPDPDQAFDADGAANPWYYEMAEMGFNYRASDIHCALGLSQLDKLDGFIARRRALADRYDEALRPLAPLVRPIERVERCDPAWHIYVVAIDFDGAGITRAALGAFQKNTLESNLQQLRITAENLISAESTIRDLDMAAEVAEFTRNQIMVEAATAMLAHANTVPKTVITLLR